MVWRAVIAMQRISPKTPRTNERTNAFAAANTGGLENEAADFLSFYAQPQL